MLFNKLLIGFVLICFSVSAFDSHVPELKKRSSAKTSFVAGHSIDFPFATKEEGPPVMHSITLPLLSKTVLPPLFLTRKISGEYQYEYTRQRILHVAWMPTIPIALRRLTI